MSGGFNGAKMSVSHRTSEIISLNNNTKLEARHVVIPAFQLIDYLSHS